jgi:hypothetical protein
MLATEKKDKLMVRLSCKTAVMTCVVIVGVVELSSSSLGVPFKSSPRSSHIIRFAFLPLPCLVSRRSFGFFVHHRKSLTNLRYFAFSKMSSVPINSVIPFVSYSLQTYLVLNNVRVNPTYQK